MSYKVIQLHILSYELPIGELCHWHQLAVCEKKTQVMRLQIYFIINHFRQFEPDKEGNDVCNFCFSERY